VVVIQVVMTAFAAWLMDKAGRRLLLLISSGGTAICLFLVGLAFFLKNHVSGGSHETGYSVLALTGVLVYIIAFSLGMGAVPWIIMSEILPVNVKGVGGSIATLTNWLTSFLVTMTINLLLEWSSSGKFIAFNVKICCRRLGLSISWHQEVGWIRNKYESNVMSTNG
jgi:SP family sugar porter-like MFS transporter